MCCCLCVELRVLLLEKQVIRCIGPCLTIAIVPPQRKQTKKSTGPEPIASGPCFALELPLWLFLACIEQ